MKIFYVDFENVKDKGLNGIAKLHQEDVVRIYYSEGAEKITFGTHRRITESPAKFEYSRIRKDLKGVKNALDVILMSDISDRIIEEKNADFFIVSADGDYDNFIAEKRKRKINISKIGEVCQASQMEKPQVKSGNSKNKGQEEALNKKEQVFKSHFGKYLKDEYEEDRDEIWEAYKNAESRQELNNNLQQYFCNEYVSDILNRLGNLAKNLPGKTPH